MQEEGLSCMVNNINITLTSKSIFCKLETFWTETVEAIVVLDATKLAP